ncbi:MAG: glutamine-hydrolyzing GMP synthase [Nanoarchaeota archaeon]|nr:glutamine-hydrolyzing GMP synthase [Nanoarchaeota archaeon]
MIIVLNFGGQTCHLIAKRVRSLGVYSEILPYDVSLDRIKNMKPRGIILSGGPSSVYDKGAPQIDAKLFSLGIPTLGICYGMQLMGKVFGEVVARRIKEYGNKRVTVVKQGSLLKGLKKNEQVWMSHGDQVEGLPTDFSVLGKTEDCPYAAVENIRAKLYGVQFHPEVAHTLSGESILRNFVFDICKCKKDFVIKDFAQKLIREIKGTVGSESVIMGASGGVDSTVAATLLHEAIGDNLHCVFVDTGLIRKGEAEEVKGYFSELDFKHFHMVDASALFLKRLRGVSDPEKKRKIIGHTFIDVFERKVKELERKFPAISFLGQGTIYPDRIESAQSSKTASKIKSHHNLTLPDKMKLKVIEPLRDLYKDDVRVLGKEIGVASELIGRHPFPGPGLAIRILGEITPRKIRLVQEADFIFISELKKQGYYDQVWQAFVALLPVKSVGVMGDARTYEYMVVLRAVTSRDAMTADWAKLPAAFLERVSNRIVNEVESVNRVVYDITQKPPATIEYE